MKYKKVGTKVVVRIDKGEEIVQTLKQICTQLQIKAGTITGIGATDKVTIGIFNTKTKQYQSTELTTDHEIAPIIGNISTMNGEVYLHLHANLCNTKHISVGGHLTSAVVSVTFEAVIDIIDEEIERVFDEKTGLNILKIH